MPLARSVVRNGILLEFADYLASREISFDGLRETVGLEALQPDDPKQALPLDAVIGLFERAGQLLDDPCLGLKFGMRLRRGASGLIGQLVINAPDVRTALRSVMDYFPVFISDFNIQTEHIAGEVRLIWHLPDGSLARQRQFNMFFAAATIARVRPAAGSDWSPMRVEFTCEEPPCRTDILAAFGPCVRFSSNQNSIGLDAACLSLPMPGADPQLYLLLRELAEKWLREGAKSPGIVGEVRQKIAGRLRQNEIELEDIAASLGIGGRSLQWRLEQAGTTFEKVRDDVRRNLAEHYLRDTEMPLVEIAHELGFSEQSAFSRAAQRWFEQSPRSYRQSHRKTRTDPSDEPQEAGGG